MTLPLPDRNPSHNEDEIAKHFPIQTADLANRSVTGSKLGTLSTTKAASSDLTLTTPAADVAGCTYTTTVAGTWLISGTFYFFQTVTGGVTGVGDIVVDGVAQTPKAFSAIDVTLAETKTITNIATLAAGKVIKLQAYKSTNAGTTKVLALNTKLTIVQIG